MFAMSFYLKAVVVVIVW